jgi:thymidylate synthase
MKFTNKDLHPDGRPYTQEEFINKIKTDDEFAKKWGDLGPIYGKQWRSWETRRLMSREDVVGEPQSLPEYFEVNKPIDQIANLINDLKTNPDSRRLMVNAWNVADLPVTDHRTDDELYQDYLKDFEKK